MSCEAPKNCPICKKSLGEHNSVIRAFYKEGTDIQINLKGHYSPKSKDGLPAGTFCFYEDIDVDSDLPEENDKCAHCNECISYD